jgi:polar amino acid transport system substrate-binding protein
MRSVLRPAVTAGVIAITLVGAAACGSGSSGGTSAGGSTVTTKGTLTVALDASYAPNEFFGTDGKTIMGMDADLANAIGKQLNMKVDLTNETFDDILAGIQTGKFDLAMSSFTDTKDREKIVDFVDYFKAGTSFYTAANGPAITGLESLCGLKVAVEKGTTQQTDAEGQSKKCTGGKSVTVDTFGDQNGANLAIQSGHDQVGMADSPVAAYQVKQSNGVFKLAGTPYGVAPYGIGIKQGSPLVQQVDDAIKALIADGTYGQIMTKWGVQAGDVTAPTINGAIS